MVNSGAVAQTWMPGGKTARESPDRRKPFMVRWTVNGREKSESFMSFGLADSRRSKLMTAARDGEPFDEHTGLPASELRAIK